ncbi:MAG: pantoate--beta-alanine ligase [Planctomycetes bacterium DG_23]|nr:MAG: pantoate--beta-alanine ligase [Planctomycetes bacterium DG_23]
MLVKKISELRKILSQARREGKTIGFVPTMGALHEGHFSLIRAARQETDFLVTSIFVNPTQFAPSEDFAQYPRDLEGDLKKAEEIGVDLVFAPSAEEMYTEGFATYVWQERLTERMCGLSRPGFFRGVATVVTKLFNIVGPCVAYFGQKDYQQSVVVRRMVRDLNMEVEIRVLPTVRQSDGLAMSSRNKHLSESERQEALCLYQALKEAEALVAAGERKSEKIIEKMREIVAGAPSARIDYMVVVDPENLEDIETIEGEVLVALAVWIGKTRLIDNMLISPEKSEA